MSSKKPEFVKVRDLDTGETASIPLSELPPGMVCISIRGESVWVKQEQLRVVNASPKLPRPPDPKAIK
jgi:hypothetical protein